MIPSLAIKHYYIIISFIIIELISGCGDSSRSQPPNTPETNGSRGAYPTSESRKVASNCGNVKDELTRILKDKYGNEYRLLEVNWFNPVTTQKRVDVGGLNCEISATLRLQDFVATVNVVPFEILPLADNSGSRISIHAPELVATINQLGQLIAASDSEAKRIRLESIDVANQKKYKPVLGRYRNESKYIELSLSQGGVVVKVDASSIFYSNGPIFLNNKTIVVGGGAKCKLEITLLESEESIRTKTVSNSKCPEDINGMTFQKEMELHELLEHRRRNP